MNNVDNASGVEEIAVTNMTAGVTDEELNKAILKTVEAAFRGEGAKWGEVNIVLTNDSFLRNLNREYRKKDQPTDVLSFNMSDETSEIIEGDIYISMNRAQQQAAEFGCDLNDEILRLTVHASLHLCGYEHEDDVSLSKMIELGENYISDLIIKEE